MPRMSKSYRLNLIRAVATKNQQLQTDDPFAQHVYELMHQQPNVENKKEFNSSFHGCYFDTQAGGWISNHWKMN
jgi:hypothetical protein